jgi:hypothetical protein
MVISFSFALLVSSISGDDDGREGKKQKTHHIIATKPQHVPQKHFPIMSQQQKKATWKQVVDINTNKYTAIAIVHKCANICEQK